MIRQVVQQIGRLEIGPLLLQSLQLPSGPSGDLPAATSRQPRITLLEQIGIKKGDVKQPSAACRTTLNAADPIPNLHLALGKPGVHCLQKMPVSQGDGIECGCIHHYE
jgi:hypothetical protein